MEELGLGFSTWDLGQGLGLDNKFHNTWSSISEEKLAPCLSTTNWETNLRYREYLNHARRLFWQCHPMQRRADVWETNAAALNNLTQLWRCVCCISISSFISHISHNSLAFYKKQGSSWILSISSLHTCQRSLRIIFVECSVLDLSTAALYSFCNL